MMTRGKPFQKGRSGNPAGRKHGSRNRTASALERVLDDRAEAIVRKAAELAEVGDATALRLCLDRLVPPRRDRTVVFALPEITTPADLPKATGALLQAVAAGELTPAEAADIGKMLDTHVKAMEASSMEARLIALEERNAGGGRRP